MLLGLDGQDDIKVVWDSYHDHEGVFEAFMRNGLRQSSLNLGCMWYRDEEWEVEGEIEEGPPVKHEFVFRARGDVKCEEFGMGFGEGDEIACCEVFKYGPEDMKAQFQASGLEEIGIFKASNAPFCEHSILESPGCFASVGMRFADSF